MTRYQTLLSEVHTVYGLLDAAEQARMCGEAQIAKKLAIKAEKARSKALNLLKALKLGRYSACV